MTSPDKDAPREIRQLLLRFAGVNPYGKPNWRVCLAQHVMVKRGGVFHQLDGTRKTMFVPAPDGKRYYQPISDRVTTGWMEVPKYPHRGWIMERWFPAHTFGTKEQWEGHRSEDGSPMMGPFPTEGGYFMVNQKPFPKMPEWSDLENAIAHWEREQRLRPENFAAALAQAVKDEQDDLVRRREKLEQELEEMRCSELLPVLRGTSLSAQRFRNQLAASVGDHSHASIL
jgi:hypothetical protein